MIQTNLARIVQNTFKDNHRRIYICRLLTVQHQTITPLYGNKWQTAGQYCHQEQHTRYQHDIYRLLNDITSHCKGGVGSQHRYYCSSKIETSQSFKNFDRNF